jgi:hypothetical protein
MVFGPWSGFHCQVVLFMVVHTEELEGEIMQFLSQVISIYDAILYYRPFTQRI